MYPFIEKTNITDLGFGGGFALWGFRAIAGGRRNCCQLNTGFNKAFSMDNQETRSQHGGTHGRLAINALKSFSYQLGTIGKRKVILSSSGTMRLTADEICVVAALSAAQKGAVELCHAHLLWLLATSQTHYAYQAAVTYGLVCKGAGIEIESPQMHLLSEKEGRDNDFAVQTIGLRR